VTGRRVHTELIPAIYHHLYCVGSSRCSLLALQSSSVTVAVNEVDQVRQGFCNTHVSVMHKTWLRICGTTLSTYRRPWVWSTPGPVQVTRDLVPGAVFAWAR
jgi:hypothetical protein